MPLKKPEDCKRERFVEKIINPNDKEKESQNFMREADESFDSAEKFIDIGKYKYSMVAGYDAMEFSAKSVLALKGIKVKQHACVFIFLRHIFDHSLLKSRDIRTIKSAHEESKQAHYLTGGRVMKMKAKKFLDDDVKPFVKIMKKLSIKIRDEEREKKEKKKSKSTS